MPFRINAISNCLLEPLIPVGPVAVTLVGNIPAQERSFFVECQIFFSNKANDFSLRCHIQFFHIGNLTFHKTLLTSVQTTVNSVATNKIPLFFLFVNK